MTTTQAIARIYRDPSRKPLATIVKEVVSYCVTRKENPTGYLVNMLYRTEAGDPRSYVSLREIRKVQLYQRDSAIGQFFANKVLFHHHLSQVGTPLPTLVGYNVGKIFFLKNGTRSIETLAEFRMLLSELISEFPRIFVKSALGAGGGNAILITGQTLQDPKLAAIHKKIASTSYIFQERIRQHPVLEAFHPGSVNSMRLMTCMRGSNIEVLSAVIRFGTSGSYVDNASSGGLFVGVDLATGKLMGPARTYYTKGGEKYDAHPDTGKSFTNFTVPYFPDVLNVAMECCRHLPYKLVGWDIAVSENGPIIIEGNDWPGFDLVQVAYGGYKSHPTFGPFVEEILTAGNRSKRRRSTGCDAASGDGMISGNDVSIGAGPNA